MHCFIYPIPEVLTPPPWICYTISPPDKAKAFLCATFNGKKVKSIEKLLNSNFLAFPRVISFASTENKGHGLWNHPIPH